MRDHKRTNARDNPLPVNGQWAPPPIVTFSGFVCCGCLGTCLTLQLWFNFVECCLRCGACEAAHASGLSSSDCASGRGEALRLMKDTVHHCSLKCGSPVQNDSIMCDVWRVFKGEKDLTSGEYQGGPLYLNRDASTTISAIGGHVPSFHGARRKAATASLNGSCVCARKILS